MTTIYGVINGLKVNPQTKDYLKQIKDNPDPNITKQYERDTWTTSFVQTKKKPKWSPQVQGPTEEKDAA